MLESRMPLRDLARQARVRGRLLARAFLLVWESAPGWTAASLALVAAQGLLPLASLYLMKLLVDALTAAFGASPAASNAAAPAAATSVLLVLSFAAGVAVLEVLSRTLASYVAEA
jgi:ATP-binding cassette, subfamily B, bacterial